MLSIIKLSTAWIGFDCGSSEPNITTYSLLDAGECIFHSPKSTTTIINGELLQLVEFKQTKIYQCKIIIHRRIQHCGVFGHLIPVETGEQEYILDLDFDKCLTIHTTGVFRYDAVHVISNLKSNSTTTKGIDFAGSASGNTCTGGSYADTFGSWNNVFVQGTVTIQLFDESAQVNLQENKIRLNTGTICKFSEKTCIDLERGYTFWKEFPEGKECFTKHYEILYKGNIVKTNSSENEATIFSINDGQATFSLKITGEAVHCNRVILNTEHPKLYIFEGNSKNEYNRLLYNTDVQHNKNIINFDLSTYVNSKFVYVERHVGIQMNEIYNKLIRDKCEVERKTILNSLSLATIAPDEFAYTVTKSPGYMAKLAGEVVHLIKCTPKEVKIIHSNECFDKAKVMVKNETWFLTPKTHILTKHAKSVDCNALIPQYYKINNEWIKFIPKPIATMAPKKFNPNTDIKWTYSSITNLATVGIYSQEDLQNLHQQIMFPIEKQAVLHNIAQQIIGQGNADINLTNLFSENTIWHVITHGWDIALQKLIECGSISSAINMALIIFHIIKLIIDTFIRGYLLHTIYGFSLHLMAAIFSSITHLFMALGSTQSTKTAEKSELKEIVINKQMPEITIVRNPPPIPNRPQANDTPKTLLNTDRLPICKKRSVYNL